MLQETHLKQSDTPSIKLAKFQKQYHAPGSSKSRGMAILILNSLRSDCKKVETDDKSHFVLIKGKLESQLANLCSKLSSTYILRGDFCQVSALPRGHLILGGDLNIVANRLVDWSGTSNHRRHKKRKQRDWRFLQIWKKNRFNLTDAWRHVNPSMRDYTVSRPNIIIT